MRLKLPLLSTEKNSLIRSFAELRGIDFLTPTEFSWRDWSPDFSCSGTMTITGITIDEAIYCNIGQIVWFNLIARFTLGGVASIQIFATPPTTMTQMNSQAGHIFAAGEGGGTVANGGRWRAADGGLLTFFKPAVAAWVLGAGSISVQGFYRK